MKKILLISGLFLTVFLLNGCATKSTPVDINKQEISSEQIRPKVLSQSLPHYPVKAQANNIEGSVTAKYDVDENGRVQNIRILDSPFANVFGLSLIHAIEQWRYETGNPAKDLITVVDFKSTVSH
ncbi:TonB family protein [Proteus vulgaris]|uniref:TonB family protein n=1 Tax=Proteus vulgaris TaxID=585 RepID=UPI0021B1582C|nr:TonB family protein [Proteus vulgaris]MCT6515822.1 TonB family protein [Proteus vulgaris]